MTELKYKVGDKVRMLADFSTLKKGEEHSIIQVDHCDDILPYKISGKWPPRSTYEHLPSEPNNDDLLNNTTPFGLLSPDVQDRMKAWEHGWEFWQGKNVGWIVFKPNWVSERVYRCLPAPVEPKRITTWHNVYKNSLSFGRRTRDEVEEYAGSGRTAVYRIERNEDGSNPEIFVEEV